MFINGREKVGIEKLKNRKAFIDYLQAIVDVHENLETKGKERRVLIVFDDMIGDTESNKKLSAIVTELFLEEENSIFYLRLSTIVFVSV